MVLLVLGLLLLLGLGLGDVHRWGRSERLVWRVNLLGLWVCRSVVGCLVGWKGLGKGELIEDGGLKLGNGRHYWGKSSSVPSKWRNEKRVRACWR